MSVCRTRPYAITSRRRCSSWSCRRARGMGAGASWASLKSCGWPAVPGCGSSTRCATAPVLARAAGRRAGRPADVTLAALVAGTVAAAGVLGAWDALVALERVPMRGLAGAVWEPMRRAGREGRDATLAERRRLAVLAGGALMAAGWLVAGPLLGVLAALAGPALSVGVLRARRHRYAGELRSGAAEAARALADAVGAGHS